MAIGHRVVFTCRHCGAAVLITSVLDEAEVTQLRTHVRDEHPDEDLGPDAGIAETLCHYRAA